MSTAWITDPPIPYNELKSTKFQGLSQHYSDEGDFALTDGKNYLWVYDTDDGNAVYEVYGELQNKIEGIQSVLTKKFKVEWISEHDPGFWDENEVEEEPILASIADRIAKKRS